MSFDAVASPLNPIRDALGRYKADREACDAEISKLLRERERLAALLPELRRRQRARGDRAEALRGEGGVYDHAIGDLEAQFGAAIVGAFPARDRFGGERRSLDDARRGMPPARRAPRHAAR